MCVVYAFELFLLIEYPLYSHPHIISRSLDFSCFFLLCAEYRMFYSILFLDMFCLNVCFLFGPVHFYSYFSLLLSYCSKFFGRFVCLLRGWFFIIAFDIVVSRLQSTNRERKTERDCFILEAHAYEIGKHLNWI